MDPLLIDVPERLLTARLILRCPKVADAAALNAAVVETLGDLRPWMPWAQVAPSLEETQAYCRKVNATFQLRQDLAMLIFERGPDESEGTLLGASGLHRIDWTLRSFEIGYWCRRGHTGRGVITETVTALARMAFDALAARRVEIRMDEVNPASRRVAERAGFTLEGVLRQESLTTQGEPRNTCVYSRVRGVEEP